jgi:hypothetical protein
MPNMTREQALPYVSFGVDNALVAFGTGHAMFSGPLPDPIPANAVLVGWQCGSEPLFVAVWSYMTDTRGNRDQVDADEAIDLATDMLGQKGWFTDNESPPEPDYVIGGAQS